MECIFFFKRCNTFEVIDNRVAIAIMSFFDVVTASESAEENIISRLRTRDQVSVVCMMLMHPTLHDTLPSESLLRRNLSNAGVGPVTNELMEKDTSQKHKNTNINCIKDQTLFVPSKRPQWVPTKQKFPQASHLAYTRYNTEIFISICVK